MPSLPYGNYDYKVLVSNKGYAIITNYKQLV